MLKGVRSVVIGLVVVGAAALVAGCSGGSSEGTDVSVSPGSASSTLPSAARPEVEKIAAIQVCRQVITSAGVMVRDYNTFMKVLNKTQSYDDVGSEDRWAVETLETGAEVVRKAISPDTPADIVEDVSGFVDSSDKLAERIDQRQRTGLNRASDEWGDKRTAALDRCADYLPTE